MVLEVQGKTDYARQFSRGNGCCEPMYLLRFLVSERLLQCLKLLKGTPERAVAGVGSLSVRLNLCTPF
jgi:hypothetical protein